MTEHASKEYDKSKWARGEWDSEPDRVEFIHAGFSCLMVRNDTGNWCGYVGVPSTHKAYEQDYNDVNVHVHGGLTYANKCQGHICHIPEPGMPDEVWWLGFDCAHSMDITPMMLHYGMMGGTYKNTEYVTNEVKQLAEQLAEIK